jgi:hypothetical protein
MLKGMKRIRKFFRYNTNKRMTFLTLFLSAFYRVCILIVPMKYLRRYFGVLEEESAKEESPDRYRQALRVSYIVNRVCSQTPWESKCLVRALTTQHLLKKKKISSTLYLGVGKNDENMIAHAWLRCGSYYLTGGNGDGYVQVAKFRA